MKIVFKESIAGPNYAYGPGETSEFNDKKAIKLCEAGIAKPVKNKQVETQMIDYPKHTGGGWYELSNGDKIQGKETAIQEQRELGG